MYHTTHSLRNITCGSSLAEDGAVHSWLADSSNPWIKFEFNTKRGVPGISDLTCKQGITIEELTVLLQGKKKLLGDQQLIASIHGPGPLDGLNRVGMLVAIDDIHDLTQLFPYIIAKFPLELEPSNLNVLHIIVMGNTTNRDSAGTVAGATNNDKLSEDLSKYLFTQNDTLNAHGIRRVSFFVPADVAHLRSSFHDLAYMLSPRSSTTSVPD